MRRSIYGMSLIEDIGIFERESNEIRMKYFIPFKQSLGLSGMMPHCVSFAAEEYNAK